VPDGTSVALACVAGRLVCVSPGSAHIDVAERSRTVAAALDLRFATMVWRLLPQAEPELGRVNPYPTLHELGPHAADVIDALLAELLK
jgi:hypothetical protein